MAHGERGTRIGFGGRVPVAMPRSLPWLPWIISQYFTFTDDFTINNIHFSEISCHVYRCVTELTSPTVSGHMGVLWLSYPVNKWSVRKSYWHKIGTKNLQQLKTAGYLFFSSERLRLNSDRLSCYKFAVKQLDKKFWRLHLVRNQVSPTQNAAPKRCGGAKSPHCFCIYI